MQTETATVDHVWGYVVERAGIEVTFTRQHATIPAWAAHAIIAWRANEAWQQQWLLTDFLGGLNGLGAEA